ncbi:MAG: hypothetical protein H6563_11215 [Lewinellaceae bacterium]|nr:hypothetical protein [Lewinellaceae bacterium]
MNDKNIFSEEVSFIQHHLPGLDAGSYQLTIEQEVNDNTGQSISGSDIPKRTYQFAVKGDRFRLKAPGNVLYSVFPAANASGEFTTVLPHVVFSKKTFPWIRYPNKTEPDFKKKMVAGKSVDEDIPTWLGILLLDEEDVANHPSLKLSPETVKINDLFPDGSLGNNISYFYQNPKNKDLEYGETLDDLIQVIDIPLELFWKIAPSLDDLNFLAHARQVSLINKPSLPGISDQGEPVGDFSIVFGNRFPQTGVKSYVFLVSLEELEEYLPTADGTPNASVAGDKGKSIRLAVLKSWSFYSTGETATFVDTLMALNGQSADAKTPPTVSTLQVSSQSTDPSVNDPLKMGYVPFNHQLRTGESTVSWYRGPLAPYAIPKARVKFPVTSPDQATFFDPNTGMFDVSYSAAWTLGRLLALQDKAFSAGLYKWKKETSDHLLALIEDSLIREKFEDILNTESQLESLQVNQGSLSTGDLYSKVIQLVLNGTIQKK